MQQDRYNVESCRVDGTCRVDGRSGRGLGSYVDGDLGVCRDAEDLELAEEKEEWQDYDDTPGHEDDDAEDLHAEQLAVAAVGDPDVILHIPAHSAIFTLHAAKRRRQEDP